MVKNRCSIIRLTAAVFFLSACSLPLFAVNNIPRDANNIFLSKPLAKKFFKHEVETVRFLDRQQSSVNGLIESFRGTSRYTFDLFTSAFCYGRGGVLDCQAFTYDSAVAAMAFTLAGQPQKAQKIFASYKKEFYMAKNENIGL